ncbi:hypothetical protein BDW62DRAFT_176694, partial [Aspergillus aurantiobrunneus]
MDPFAKTQTQAQTQPQVPDRASAQAGTSTPSHTEEQKRHFYENLPAEEKEKKSYTEWVKEAYNEQYEKWMPWLEDQYLKWFGKGDNKASYVAKDTLSKTKVPGSDQANQLQDDTNNLIGNQFGEKGYLAPAGNLVSKEGFNRAESGGKDEGGSYGGPLGGVTDPVVQGVKGLGSSIQSGAQNVGSSIGNVIPGGS